MKKQIAILSFLFASFSAVGQDGETSMKGKFGLGGAMGYFENTGSYNTSASLTGASQAFKIVPSFIYFAKKNLAIGLGAGYQRYQYPDLYSRSKSTLFSISPMVQYFIPLASDKFGLFFRAMWLTERVRTHTSTPVLLRPMLPLLPEASLLEYTSSLQRNLCLMLRLEVFSGTPNNHQKEMSVLLMMKMHQQELPLRF